MHSYIYQIGLKPFNEEKLLDPDTLDVGENSLLDYAYDISAEIRAVNIRILVETILPAGMFTIDSDNNLIYQGGFKIWRKAYFDEVKDLTNALTPANIMGNGRQHSDLKHALDNPLNTVRLFESGYREIEYSISIMHLVDGLNKGDKLYVGSVLGYHN